jgi:hypothetical protein
MPKSSLARGNRELKVGEEIWVALGSPGLGLLDFLQHMRYLLSGRPTATKRRCCIAPGQGG